MKNKIQLIIIFFTAFIIDGCSPSPAPTPSLPSCILTTVFNTGYVNFVYGSNGNPTTLKYSARVGGALTDSVAVTDYTVAQYYVSSSGFPMIQTTTYTGNNSSVPMDIFDGYPEESHTAQTEGAITHTNVRSYYYYYDNKNRINKVIQQTENFVGDYEYNLFISYDDQDNVSAIKYEWTTGPNTSITMVPTGYDNKLNPISALKGGRFLFSNWDYAYTLFTSLSKNNCLGYTVSDSKVVSSYTYNDKNFPITQTNVNTNLSSGQSASSSSTFTYDCQ